MASDQDTANSIILRWEKLKSDRGVWDAHFQDLTEFIRPIGGDFTTSHTVKGEERHDKLFDGTAEQAAEELASGLSSFLTNPADRFFNLEIRGSIKDRFENQEALEWLETVADTIYHYFSIEESRFYQAIDEVYLDLAVYGTGILYMEWDRKNKRLLFKSIPLAGSWIAQNSDGLVDTIFRETEMTGRNIMQKWGVNVPPKIREAATKRMDDNFFILHAVFPRTDRKAMKLNKVNKAFGSFWVAVKTQELIEESGFKNFQFMGPRWRKMAQEVYGRSPGMQCLPDIKMLNKMEEIILMAAAKAVDPPLMIPDDGFIGDIRTEPGSLNPKFPGSEPIEVLPTALASLPFAEEKSEQKRNVIRMCFHSDWLKLGKETVEMTAFEVQDRREEKLRLLAPSLARIQSELIGPMIELTYKLLLEHTEEIPDIPKVIKEQDFKIEYVSAASKAQLGIKVLAIDRYIQRLIPLAQIDPSILDAVDLDAVAQELAVYQGVPRRILRALEDITNIRTQRQQQQALQQAADIAEPGSQAVLNISKARAEGGV